MTTRTIALLAVAGLLVTLIGCGPSEVEILRTEVRGLENQIADLEKDKTELEEGLVQRDEQIETLLGLGDKRLEQLYYVQSIRLGKYSGGYDSDGEPGDEGVKIYLSCVDQEGTTIKAAGSLTIELFDLGAEAGDIPLGEYTFTVEELGQWWSSGFMSYNYSVECPWQAGPPDHEEVTFVVKFTDYLTGESFKTQGVGPVALPGDVIAEETPLAPEEDE